MMRRAAWVSIGLILGLIVGLRGASASCLRVVEPWRCFFAGEDRPPVLHIEALADRLMQVRISWRFSAVRAVLATGERVVLAGPERGVIIPLRMPCAAPSPPTVIPGRLTVSMSRLSDCRQLARLEVPLRFYGRDPLAERRQWVTSLDLHLFDPRGTTAERLQSLGIPFQRIGDPRTRRRPAPGVFLIMGAGVSFRDYPGLLAWLVRTSAQGSHVLCLAPATGRLSFAEPPISRAVHALFEGKDKIALLDPKLDADAWPPDGSLTASSLIFSTDDTGPSLLTIVPGNQGWSWLDLGFETGGQFVFCGFDIIGKWGDGPVPRYLLVRLLESMRTKAPTNIKEKPHVFTAPRAP